MCKFKREFILLLYFWLLQTCKMGQIDRICNSVFANTKFFIQLQFYKKRLVSFYNYNVNAPSCATKPRQNLYLPFAGKVFVKHSAFNSNLNVCIYTRLKFWVSINRSNSKNYKATFQILWRYISREQTY